MSHFRPGFFAAGFDFRAAVPVGASRKKFLESFTNVCMIGDS
jgi:hypothetical protein